MVLLYDYVGAPAHAFSLFLSLAHVPARLRGADDRVPSLGQLTGVSRSVRIYLAPGVNCRLCLANEKFRLRTERTYNTLRTPLSFMLSTLTNV